MKSAQQLLFPGGVSKLTPDGSELPDSRPVEVPIGFERPESIQDLIRRLVRDPAIREDLTSSDAESFDEADDFEIDDGMPVSPHEDNFDPMHLLARDQELRSGTVAERTPEEIKAAKALLDSHLPKLDNPAA